MASDLWDLMFSQSALLLAKATAEKQKGNLDAAIETLKLAYRVAGEEGIDHGIQSHLRLPLYLQKASRFDEAWDEFNRLALQGYPGEIRNRKLLPPTLAAIFDKMRLSLQREKMVEQAVRFGVWKHLCVVTDLKPQSKSNLALFLEWKWAEQAMTPLLKKAKRSDLLDQIVKMVELEMLDPNLPSIGDRIDDLLIGPRRSKTPVDYSQLQRLVESE